jgi:plasmid maintenance system antidote protein VapI
MGLFHTQQVVLRPPRLITELIALAKEWGWSVDDLARELHVHRTTLLHQRAGRHGINTAMLARIARRFRSDRSIRDLVWNYLTVEYEEAGASARAIPAASTHIPREVATGLRSYLARFGEESVHGGRGLYLASADAAVLTAALQWLQKAFREQRIEPCVLRADRSPSASEARFALAAPVLMLERVDFLSDASADVVRRRADLVRPIIATSMQPLDAISDPYLRRIFASTMRALAIGPSPTSTHGSLSASTERQSGTSAS